MPDDQVTIDPRFQPAAGGGNGRWLRLAWIGAVFVAVLLLASFLELPTSGEPERKQTSASAIAPTTETIPTTVTSRNTTTTPTGMAVPLGEAAPGFTDTVTVGVITESGGVDVVRWRSSQSALETVISLRDDDDHRARFAGLDATGTWYALHDDNGVLSAGMVGPVDDEDAWWGATPEPVGLRVVAASWHDTEPGRLAWVSCPRVPGGPGTLSTLDLVDGSAEAQPVVALSDACRGLAEAWVGWWEAVSINQWGDWGFALGGAGIGVGDADSEEDDATTILLDPVGVELARIEDGWGGAHIAGAGPFGTVWTENPPVGPSSYLLSLDGQRRTEVPGLSDGEWVERAQWSPDGSLLALVPSSAQPGDSSIRIVDAATSEIVAEISEPDSAVWSPCWSSDGRFLLYGRSRHGMAEPETELVAYDIAVAGVASEMPLSEHDGFAEIRTFDPATIVRRFTPVQWHISLDELGPGVHTVSMVVDVRPLTRHQIEDLSGRLVWGETVVDLCGIGVRSVGSSSARLGDIFQTTEGCGTNPEAMQEAFDEFGLPERGCVTFGSEGVENEYCAPLTGSVTARAPGG